MSTRRDFLKQLTAAAAAMSVPLIINPKLSAKTSKSRSKIIVPKGAGIPITGTFLDEISTDIPHQNWGEKEWDADFKYMKAIGIDTVILIRSGLGKFITYPSKYLLSQGCYMPSMDLLDMFLRLADKYDMHFWFGLYNSGLPYPEGAAVDIENNFHVVDEVWEKYLSKHKCFTGWYLSKEVSRRVKGIIDSYKAIALHCKGISGGLPVFISPYIDGRKQINHMGFDGPITLDQHVKDWDEILNGIKGAVDIIAFQDGHVDFDELPDYMTANKMLADRYGMECWTNAESFDRDMPINFLPIKFDKLRYKLEAAQKAGVSKAITFEFSHFMSPQSAYLQAGHLYDRYKEYFRI
jgi:hypothetical protein